MQDGQAVPFVALIDGDILVYQAAAIVAAARYDVYSLSGELFATNIREASARKFSTGVYEHIRVLDDLPVEQGYQAIHNIIQKCANACEADAVRLFMTDSKTNFRLSLATTFPYKGQRPEKPKYYNEMRDYLLSMPNVTLSNGCEADDLLGIAGSELRGSCAICSIDKDLNMIPGDHYNFTTGEYYHVDDESALINFYTQILTGDTADNIQGLHGVGPVKARRILDGLDIFNAEQVFTRILREYHAHLGGASFTVEDSYRRLVENAQLLWIWRKDGDIYEPPYTASQIAAQLR